MKPLKPYVRMSAFLIQAGLFLGLALPVQAKPLNIEIPSELGRIESSFEAQGGDRMVIHIQDVHAHSEAQENIGRLLEHLSKEYGIELVTVEGSAGPIDVDLFSCIPHAEVRAYWAREALREASITGPEKVAIAERLPIELVGVEEPALYIQDFNAFRSIHPLSASTVFLLVNFDSSLQALRERAYPEKVLALDAARTRYLRNEMSLPQYLNLLWAESGNAGLDLESAYPAVWSVVRSAELEGTLDRKGLQADLESLLRRFLARMKNEPVGTKSVAALFEEFQEDQDLIAFVTRLSGIWEGAGAQMKDLEQLNLALELARLQQNLEPGRLLAEIPVLEDELFESLLGESSALRVYELGNRLDSIRKVLNAHASSREWEHFEAVQQKGGLEACLGELYDLATAFSVETSLRRSDLTPEIARNLSSAIEFYEIASERNEGLIRHTLAAMQERQTHVAVLIAGGYHSRGLEELLEESDISYIAIAPRVTQEAEESLYLERMLGQRLKSPGSVVALSKTSSGLAFTSALARYALLEDNVTYMQVRALANGVLEAYEAVFPQMPDRQVREIYGQALTQAFGERREVASKYRLLLTGSEDEFSSDAVTGKDMVYALLTQAVKDHERGVDTGFRRMQTLEAWPITDLSRRWLGVYSKALRDSDESLSGDLVVLKNLLEAVQAIQDDSPGAQLKMMDPEQADSWGVMAQAEGYTIWVHPALLEALMEGSTILDETTRPQMILLAGELNRISRQGLRKRFIQPARGEFRSIGTVDQYVQRIGSFPLSDRVDIELRDELVAALRIMTSRFGGARTVAYFDASEADQHLAWVEDDTLWLDRAHFEGLLDEEHPEKWFTSARLLLAFAEAKHSDRDPTFLDALDFAQKVYGLAAQVERSSRYPGSYWEEAIAWAVKNGFQNEAVEELMAVLRADPESLVHGRLTDAGWNQIIRFSRNYYWQTTEKFSDEDIKFHIEGLRSFRGYRLIRPEQVETLRQEYARLGAIGFTPSMHQILKDLAWGHTPAQESELAGTRGFDPATRIEPIEAEHLGLEGQEEGVGFPNPLQTMDPQTKARLKDKLERVAILVSAGGSGSRLMDSLPPDLIQELAQWGFLSKPTMPAGPASLTHSLSKTLGTIATLEDFFGITIPTLLVVTPDTGQEAIRAIWENTVGPQELTAPKGLCMVNLEMLPGFGDNGRILTQDRLTQDGIEIVRTTGGHMGVLRSMEMPLSERRGVALSPGIQTFRELIEQGIPGQEKVEGFFMVFGTDPVANTPSFLMRMMNMAIHDDGNSDFITFLGMPVYDIENRPQGGTFARFVYPDGSSSIEIVEHSQRKADGVLDRALAEADREHALKLARAGKTPEGLSFNTGPIFLSQAALDQALGAFRRGEFPWEIAYKSQEIWIHPNDLRPEDVILRDVLVKEEDGRVHSRHPEGKVLVRRSLLKIEDLLYRLTSVVQEGEGDQVRVGQQDPVDYQALKDAASVVQAAHKIYVRSRERLEALGFEISGGLSWMMGEWFDLYTRIAEGLPDGQDLLLVNYRDASKQSEARVQAAKLDAAKREALELAGELRAIELETSFGGGFDIRSRVRCGENVTLDEGVGQFHLGIFGFEVGDNVRWEAGTRFSVQGKGTMRIGNGVELGPEAQVMAWVSKGKVHRLVRKRDASMRLTAVQTQGQSVGDLLKAGTLEADTNSGIYLEEGVQISVMGRVRITGGGSLILGQGVEIGENDLIDIVIPEGYVYVVENEPDGGSLLGALAADRLPGTAGTTAPFAFQLLESAL
ncbi:MAG: hypothetical protein JW937_00355 [Candidatus Omnitrophica bacterium]|nr:hypothetical protein [Candidatus Omnitrophota bacterium]